jgi:hypothetical protein
MRTGAGGTCGRAQRSTAVARRPLRQRSSSTSTPHRVCSLITRPAVHAGGSAGSSSISQSPADSDCGTVPGLHGAQPGTAATAATASLFAREIRSGEVPVPGALKPTVEVEPTDSNTTLGRLGCPGTLVALTRPAEGAEAGRLPG